jgi:hypothetical protein
LSAAVAPDSEIAVAANVTLPLRSSTLRRTFLFSLTLSRVVPAGSSASAVLDLNFFPALPLARMETSHAVEQVTLTLRRSAFCLPLALRSKSKADAGVSRLKTERDLEVPAVT